MFKYFGKLLITSVIALVITSCNESKVQYYYGESKMYLPNENNEPGKFIGSSNGLIKRITDPDTKSVIEQVISIIPHKTPQEFLVTFKLNSDDTFDETEKNNAFHGTGKLFGEKWKWQSWESESFLPDNAKIISKDTESDEKLKVKKFYYSPDGKLRVLFIEEYNKIEKSEFLKQYNKLFPINNSSEIK